MVRRLFLLLLPLLLSGCSSVGAPWDSSSGWTVVVAIGQGFSLVTDLGGEDCIILGSPPTIVPGWVATIEDANRNQIAETFVQTQFEEFGADAVAASGFPSDPASPCMLVAVFKNIAILEEGFSLSLTPGTGQVPHLDSEEDVGFNFLFSG
jgi:hypothetical protein